MNERIALIAHAFRLKPEHDLFFIDYTNAFNQVDRVEAARAIIAKCPRLANTTIFFIKRTPTFGYVGMMTSGPLIQVRKEAYRDVFKHRLFLFLALTTYTNVKSLLGTKKTLYLVPFLMTV
jgi:hypothetical protein